VGIDYGTEPLEEIEQFLLDCGDIPPGAVRAVAMARQRDARGDPTAIGYHIQAQSLGYNPEEDQQG